MGSALAGAPHMNDAAYRRSLLLSADFKEAAEIARRRRIDCDAGACPVVCVAFGHDQATVASCSEAPRQFDADLAAIVEQQPRGGSCVALRGDRLGLPVH